MNDKQLIWEAYNQLTEMSGYSLDELKSEIQLIAGQLPSDQVGYLRDIVDDILERKTASVWNIRQTLEAGNVDPEVIRALLDFEGPYLGQGR